MKLTTKQELIAALRAVRDNGWVRNARKGNAGGVGNTLEDLLGIEENNLPIPNAAEWELKCQRASTAALTTLFHMEPSPRACRLVPSMLLPLYGWRHEKAGTSYPLSERSFRQTINAVSRTDRGFGIVVDTANRRVAVSFDISQVAHRHKDWLATVSRNAGTGELSPQPYWGFDDLFHKAGTKLTNCFYVVADVKHRGGEEWFWYKHIWMLESLSLEAFVNAISRGDILVDFDARTGHNHGTKFRLRQNALPSLFSRATPL